jgi:hypothetical protein
MARKVHLLLGDRTGLLKRAMEYPNRFFRTAPKSRRSVKRRRRTSQKYPARARRFPLCRSTAAYRKYTHRVAPRLAVRMVSSKGTHQHHDTPGVFSVGSFGRFACQLWQRTIARRRNRLFESVVRRFRGSCPKIAQRISCELSKHFAVPIIRFQCCWTDLNRRDAPAADVDFRSGDR